MDKPWKQHERRAAALIGGRRYPANLGGPIDCESATFVAQCKEVKVLAFPALERLALEAERQGSQRQKIGLCVVKRRAGSGVRTPTLVVMTAASFRAMSGPLPTPLPHPGRGGAVNAALRAIRRRVRDTRCEICAPVQEPDA